jgi:hypothetical protein
MTLERQFDTGLTVVCWSIALAVICDMIEAIKAASRSVSPFLD